MFLALPALSSRKCLPRSYGDERIVCVCNNNYCDTIEPVRKISPKLYLKYTSDKAGKRLEKSIGYFSSINNTKSVLTVEVKSNIRYQTTVGFGGAFTDATGINVMLLNEKLRSKLMT